MSHAPLRPLLGSSLLLLDSPHCRRESQRGIRKSSGDFVLLCTRRAHLAVVVAIGVVVGMLSVVQLPTAYAGTAG